MKITESHLRKIIRGTLQEMMRATDGITATGTMHDNPLVAAQEEPTGSPSDIVDQILSAYQKGDQVDGNLLSKLQQLQAQLGDAPPQQTDMNFSGLGESRKKK